MSKSIPPVASFASCTLRSASGEELPAGKLWDNQPAVILLLRRPGCVLCRYEAQGIWELKPELDQLGVRLACIVHEWLPAEVQDFTQHFWPGEVYLDTTKTLFKAVGGGELKKGNMMHMLNPFSSSWKRIIQAKKKVSHFTVAGNGLTMGGLMVLRKGSGGVEYLFTEEDFGLHAETDDVLAAAATAKKMSV